MKRTARKRKPSREKSEPVTLTMRPIYFEKAEAIMALTGETLSELTRRLINEAYERRFGATESKHQNTPGN